MSAKDYIFRIIGTFTVWRVLAMMVMEADLFIPSDLFETSVAHGVLAAGTLCTLAIWCGPELARRCVWRNQDGDD